MTVWKQVEREIARLLGGRRVPVTGRQRGSAPDIEHEWLSLEVKHRRQLPAWLLDAIDQAGRSRRGEQLPVAVLHQHRQQYADSLVVVRLRDWINYFGE